MRAGDLMTKNAATIRIGDLASAAARLMWDCDYGSLPILDESDKECAVVTDRDLSIATLCQESVFGSFPGSQAMSQNLSVCSADDGVSSADEAADICAPREGADPMA